MASTGVFLVLALSFLVKCSRGAEYKVCATEAQEPMCNWLEASGSEVRCVIVSDSVDCLLKLHRNEADFGSFYPEEAFLVARFMGDAAVVIAEIRHPDRADKPFSFQTVAVVRKILFGGLSGLKNLSYCHPGFSRAQYWSDRVLKEFETKVLDHFKDDIKCSSAARSAYEEELHRLSLVFRTACRPGAWAVNDWWDKKLKRDYHTLCDQCEQPATCSYDVRNKGRHSDALRCLTQHGGNVTYTALEYVREYFHLDSDDIIFSAEHRNPARYNFLCPDGSTLPLTSSDPCSWINQPWTSIVTTNSSAPMLRQILKDRLLNDSNVSRSNHLRTILTRGNGVIHFRDQSLPVAKYIELGRTIPDSEGDSCRKPVRWCVIGRTENTKCNYISAAALTHGLPTPIHCVPAESKMHCLSKIADQKADFVYVDTDLAYIARKLYNLTASAFLETQTSGNYFGVVVVKGDDIKRIKDLKGKRACFPQYDGSGWLTYIEMLKSGSVLPRHACSDAKKAWMYFSEACAPGAKDPNLNIGWQKVPNHLCKGCAGEGASCEPKAKNSYYGEIGALKCLANDDGDVAFLDFHAARKYLASNRLTDNFPDGQNFKIICKDGSLETFNLTNPEKCSFTQLNAGQVVTRMDMDTVRWNDIRQTLMELDDLFGTTSRAYHPPLRMFQPFDGVTDVLFKDSAVSLLGVHHTQNTYVNNYLKLLNGLENCVSDSGSSTLFPSIIAIAFSIWFILYGN